MCAGACSPCHHTTRLTVTGGEWPQVDRALAPSDAVRLGTTAFSGRWEHPDRTRAATAPAAHGGDNRRMQHCTGAFRRGSRSAWWRQHDNDMSAAPCCRGAALPALQAEGAPFWRNSAGFRAQGEALLLPCCPRASPTRVGLAKRPRTHCEVAQKHHLTKGFSGASSDS